MPRFSELFDLHKISDEIKTDAKNGEVDWKISCGVVSYRFRYEDH
jgi:hypothetical protein